MCIAPSVPKAKAPLLAPPAQKKKLELNPALTASAGQKTKQLGTRKLQIPLGGTGGGSGLNTGA